MSIKVCNRIRQLDWCKGRRKRENIAAETFCVNVAHSVAWVSQREGSKIVFCFETQTLRFEHICCVGTRTRERSRIIQNRCFFSVSQMFPLLLLRLLDRKVDKVQFFIDLENIQYKLSSDYSLNICFSRRFRYIDGPSFSPYKPSQNVRF